MVTKTKTTAPAVDGEARKKLQATFAQINKEMGAGTIVTGDQIKAYQRPRITSGCLPLDVALGGGWPSNCWNEIIGLESSGKTTVIMNTIAANQERQKDYKVFWVAAEDFDVSWAEMLRCDMSKFTMMFDNGMQTVYGTVIEVLASREFDCVVIDSLPALVPEEEEEGGMTDSQVGLGARVNGKFFRKQRPALARSLTEPDRPITGFIVNQWRDQIGVMWGDPRTTPGGKNKNYEFVTRVELSRDEWLLEGKEKVGQTIKALIKKNKSAPPQRLAVFDFYFAPNELHLPVGSYDNVKALIAVGRLYDIVTLKGNQYCYDGQQWTGQAGFARALREDLGLQSTLSTEILAVSTRKTAGLSPASSSPGRRKLNRPK